MKLLSRVRLFEIPRTVVYQASLSMGFSRQECLSGLPFPSPGDLPDSGINPRSPALQADSLPSELPGKLFGRTVAKTETPILWPLDAKSYLIGKDPDAGRDWGQEEKKTTKDEMAGWHHRLNGHESE